MGAFRTNYQNATWTGDRKYTISGTGEDQTITDTTTYNPAGDPIGALEMNNIGKELNRNANVVTVELEAENWSSSAPYSQTVSIATMKSTDNPIITPCILSNDAVARVKEIKKAFACIDYATTANGSITFRCRVKKPTTYCRVYLKGVSEE